MKHALLLLFALVTLFCQPVPAQGFLPQLAAATWSISDTSYQLTEHKDGLISLVALQTVDGELVYSLAGESSAVSAAIGQNPAPTPTITTQWTDALGVTHTVSTPVPSTTPAGLAKAQATHDALVAALQAAHPPKPVIKP